MAATSKGPRPDALGHTRQASGEQPRAQKQEQEVPENLTVNETEDWVAGDKGRAQKALDAESKRNNPRSTLVDSLERLVNDETGAGVASGEA